MLSAYNLSQAQDEQSLGSNCAFKSITIQIPPPPTPLSSPRRNAVSATYDALDRMACVCVGIGLQESGKWAAVVWAAHHQHLQQRGGPQCERCLFAAGSQCQPWQNHVRPGMMPYCQFVMQSHATLSDSLRGEGCGFWASPMCIWGVFVSMLLVYSLIHGFLVLVFGRQTMSGGQITREGLLITKTIAAGLRRCMKACLRTAL